jgi:glycosyltransferase involved in cell wall biosynthesis
MIEALACGTPVIAYPRGSVPEVIEDGVTGFIVDKVADAVRAVGQVAQLRREECRRVFEERFSAARMTRDYLKVYQQVLAKPDSSAFRRPAGVSRALDAGWGPRVAAAGEVGRRAL